MKAAYYDYFFYDKALRTTQQNGSADEAVEISEARYRVGKGMQQTC